MHKDSADVRVEQLVPQMIAMAEKMADVTCIYGDDDGPDFCGDCAGCRQLEASGLFAQAIRLLATPSPAAAVVEDDGWIIGNGDRTAWRTWRDGFSAWTEKLEDATRYARRIDAETVHAEDEDAWCVIRLSEVIRANGGKAITNLAATSDHA